MYVVKIIRGANIKKFIKFTVTMGSFSKFLGDHGSPWPFLAPSLLAAIHAS